MTDTSARRPTRRRRDSPPPKTGAAEREVLLGFLDYLRTSIAAKAEGVPEPAVRAAGGASGTNLLGLIKHLTYVERRTFLGENVDDWPATFHATTDESVESVRAVGQVGAGRDGVVRLVDRVAVAGEDGPATGTKAPSLRWSLVHMIEQHGLRRPGRGRRTGPASAATDLGPLDGPPRPVPSRLSWGGSRPCPSAPGAAR